MRIYSRNVNLLVWLSIIILGLAMLVDWVAERKFAEVLDEQVASKLVATEKAMESWIESEKALASFLAREAFVVESTQKLLNAYTPNEKVGFDSAFIASGVHRKIREYMAPIMTSHDYQGYFILNREGISLCSSRDGNVGVKVFSERQDQFLQKVFSGQTAVSLPRKAKVLLNNSSGMLSEGVPTMFVGAPVYDDSQRVIAALLFRIDVYGDYSKILFANRHGRTAEVYTVDSTGALNSDSRFEQDFIETGLLELDGVSAFNFKIHQTTLNWISEAKKQGSQFSPQVSVESSFVDYRGVPVIGGWIWMHNFDLGLFYEQDAAEAYQMYHWYQRVIWALALIIWGLFFVVIRLYMQDRNRLLNNKQKLEREVKQQTDEVAARDQRNLLMLQKMGEAVYKVDVSGRVDFVNDEAMKLLGYSQQELLGSFIHDLVHHSQPDGSHYPQAECPLVSNPDTKTTELIEGQYFWSKDGRCFPVECVKTPLYEFDKFVGVVVAFKDISERLHHEEQLKESEQRYRTLISNIPGAAYRCLMDSNWTMLYLSSGIELISGYAPSAFINEPSLHFVDMIHPDDRVDVENKIAEAVANDQPWTIEYRLLHKDGFIRYVFERGRAVTDEMGQVIYLDGFIADNTEVRTTSQQLKHLNATLEELIEERTAKLEQVTQYNRTLFEKSPIGLALTDMSGNLVDANPAYLDIVGYSASELDELSYWDITPEKYAQQEQQQLQSLNSTGHYGPYEKEYRHKSGQLVPVMLNGLIIEMEGQKYIWSSVEDISEQKRNYQLIQEQEQLLRHALQSAAAGYWYFDIATGVLVGDQQSLDIFGVAENDFNHSKQDWLSSLHEADRKSVAKEFTAYLHGSSDSFVMHYRIRRPDGEIRYIQHTGNLIFDEDGKVQSCQGLIFDVTEHELWTTQLAEEKRKAEQANRAKSEFLANMSHEFRTPLNAVIGYSEMLLEDFEFMSEQEQVEELTKVLLSSKHLLALVNDLLDISKAEAGQIVLQSRPVELQQIVEELRVTVEPLMQKNGNRFEVDLADQLGEMEVDRQRLIQVLMNLLSNAAKFTCEGKVLLRISKVEIEAIPCIRFEVVDSGIGMSQTQLEKVFDRFVQADGSTTREYGGTGLGLTLVKDFVELMRGCIAVDSAPSKGSSFVVLFPQHYSELDDKADRRQLQCDQAPGKEANQQSTGGRLYAKN